MERVLNIRKSPEDGRDLLFKINRPTPIPDSFSLESYLPSKVRDQGNEGSCGGHAYVECYETLRKLYWSTLKRPVYDPDTLFSPQDMYWRIRNRMGDTTVDEGIDMRSGAESLAKDGVCREESRVYRDRDWRASPTEEQNAEAVYCKTGSYHRVMGGRNVCEAIASGYPVAIGINLYATFMGGAVASTGLVPMPKDNETCEGGHATLAHSYDKTKVIGNEVGAVKILNSWGPKWGAAGHFWVPVAYLDAHLLDGFVSHFGRPW